MYQQDDKTNYIIKEGKFSLVDRDEVADSILKNLDDIFDQFLINILGKMKNYALRDVMIRMRLIRLYVGIPVIFLERSGFMPVFFICITSTISPRLNLTS
jgi:hypothetical protein